MIYLKKPLVAQAENLLDLKNAKHIGKARKDILEIDDMLCKLGISDMYLQQAYSLDNRLDMEYPEISRLSDTAKSMQGSKTETSSTDSKNPVETVKSNLLLDRYGILASVLLKHAVVSEVKDFIEKVD